jgi:hypothetical protein
MKIAPPSPPTHSRLNTACCSTANSGSNLQWVKTVDRICRVTLAAFAAILAPIPFAVSLASGLLAGASYTAVRIYQQKPLFPDGESKPVCAQGYMDFLSGMRFPPLIGSLATATFIGAHMRHDPLFYVPFCGFFVGFWLGRDSINLGKDLTNYAFSKCDNGCCRTS